MTLDDTHFRLLVNERCLPAVPAPELIEGLLEAYVQCFKTVTKRKGPLSKDTLRDISSAFKKFPASLRTFARQNENTAVLRSLAEVVVWTDYEYAAAARSRIYHDNVQSNMMEEALENESKAYLSGFQDAVVSKWDTVELEVQNLEAQLQDAQFLHRIRQRGVIRYLQAIQRR
eukprot:ANDGO_04634.mRNA.1 hypothetical protein